MHTDSPLLLRIEGELTIQSLEEQRSRLSEAIKTTGHTLLDLSGVASIDTLGMQLLASATRTAAESGRSCRVVAASDAVLSLAALLGLAPSEFGFEPRHS